MDRERDLFTNQQVRAEAEHLETRSLIRRDEVLSRDDGLGRWFQTE